MLLNSALKLKQQDRGTVSGSPLVGRTPIPLIITWELVWGDLTQCGVLPGVVLYLTVQLTWLEIQRNNALLGAASMMTSFVKSVAMVWKVPPKFALILSTEQVAQYSPDFTPVDPIYRTGRNYLFFYNGTTQHQGRREPQVLWQEKTEQSCIHEVQK